MLLLALGHACVDIYQGTVAALVPAFVAERGYGYAAASGIVLAASLLSSVAQPAFGALTDRWALPWLLPLSTFLGGLGVAAAGLSGSYPVTLACVAVSGLGVAAYHPEAARIARLVSGRSHTAMGTFSLGGNLGFAVAPLVTAAVVGTGGLHRSPLLLVPALAGSALCLPVLRALRRNAQTDALGAARSRTDDRSAFVRLSLVVILRSIVFVGLSAFIALYAQQRTSGGAWAGSVALFLLYLGGAVGTVLGSRLANRWSRVAVLRWSYLTVAVAVAGVVVVPGPCFFVFVALASAGLYVPFSLQITLAQDYLPSRVGTASGVTLGLAVSVGGVASPLIGTVADRSSLQAALAPLIVLPVASWLVARTLREPAAPMQDPMRSPIPASQQVPARDTMGA
nr:MFS transporter [Dactylosporangium thailandense]